MSYNCLHELTSRNESVICEARKVYKGLKSYVSVYVLDEMK